MNWQITAVDASGQQRTQSKTKHSDVVLTMRTLCSGQTPVPPPSHFNVVVRPINARPDDPRMREAAVSCDELRTDPQAFDKKLPAPRSKQPTKPTVNLWD